MIRTILQDTIRPHFDKTATKLATEIDRVLPCLIPRLRPKTSAKFSNHIAQGNNFANDWRDNWIENLTHIFKVGLEWRYEVEKSCSAEYKFFFPRRGLKVPVGPEQELKLVKMGYMPEIPRETKRTLLGEFGDEMVVYDWVYAI
jgi:hypothetical protein